MVHRYTVVIMSANDILDVLNVQRDNQSQPPKKKQKVGNEQTSMRQSGMARELYNLLGPNTPPVNLSTTLNNGGIKDKLNLKPSPWTKVPFSAVSNEQNKPKIELFHWVKGSKELLEQESVTEKPYAFDKFNTKLDLPDLVDKETYEKFMEEIKQSEIRLIEEKEEREEREKEKKKEKEKEKEIEIQKEKEKEKEKERDNENGNENDSQRGNEKQNEIDSKGDENTKTNDGIQEKDTLKDDKHSSESNEPVLKTELSYEKTGEINTWTYEETKQLFELCNSFELKWPAIYDRFNYPNRSLEDLKEHFYRISVKILESQVSSNPTLIESLNSFSKSKEVERKQYLESLLKRTPAEIAEEESLVIEARRFELAAKKMLVERSHLLTLLDSPQTTQSVQQYQSSQGLANLYNNLMIIDKHQKKRQFQQQQRAAASGNHDPVPPPIPIAASSSFKKERNFQTHLQQYLSGFLKQNQSSNDKHETNAIQQLLMKRLTVKEEEAYGLHYHANEKLTPGVVLRSTQRLPGLQQRQSVLKSVNSILQELDIPTAGGTSWKPVMPTRKTMTKYDELLKSVVALLDVKKGKDKLESEIRLIKSQRDLQ